MFPTSDSPSSVDITLHEKTVSRGTASPAVWNDEKAVPDSLAPQLPPLTQTRNTAASVCIVAACMSSLMMSIALGPSTSILLPYAGKNLHIQQENLQWIVNAYSLSSVNNLRCNDIGRKSNLDLVHRRASFFSAEDWLTFTVANEYGLLDTSFCR